MGGSEVTDGFNRQRFDALFRRGDTMQVNVGGFPIFRVGSDRLAKLVGVSGEVEEVIDELEGDAGGTASATERFDVGRGGSADQRTHCEGGAEHRGRLAEQDEFNPIRIILLPVHVFGLSADEQPGACGQGEFAHESGGEGRLGSVAGGEQFEAQRLQRVASE